MYLRNMSPFSATRRPHGVHDGDMYRRYMHDGDMYLRYVSPFLIGPDGPKVHAPFRLIAFRRYPHLSHGLSSHGLLEPDDEGLAVPRTLAREETDGSRMHIEQRLD